MNRYMRRNTRNTAIASYAKLVRITLLNGQEDWIYIHIEVQGTPQAEFAERMFVYNYRIFDRYRKPIASMAVLADEQESWRPASFEREILDCRIGFHFPIVKLVLVPKL